MLEKIIYTLNMKQVTVLSESLSHSLNQFPQTADSLRSEAGDWLRLKSHTL